MYAANPFCIQDVHMSNPTSDIKDLLEFPARFPIKVMGERTDAFLPTIFDVVRLHAPDLELAHIVSRDSSSGKYVSLTVTVTATSKEQLDNIYRALSGHPLVKWAL